MNEAIAWLSFLQCFDTLASLTWRRKLAHKNLCQLLAKILFLNKRRKNSGKNRLTQVHRESGLENRVVEAVATDSYT